jgi:hypothetical protein
MAIKIDRKIVDFDVAKGTTTPAKAPAKEELAPEIEHMHELLQRPEQIEGRTYKVKPPVSEHAMYVTINDVILNPGTEHETRRPFEIFINSKNMDHFQWIVALTLIISAVFRKGGDCTFLVDELRSVFDPKGGYFKKGGRFMPSLVAEIGDIIEQHLRHIGMIDEPKLDAHQQAFIEQKKAEIVAKATVEPEKPVDAECDDATGQFPPGSQLCAKCHTKAMIVMDGCLTCLNCGESKCQ